MLIAPVGDAFDRRDGAALPEAHDRPLAELLFNLADSDVERLVAFFLIVEWHADSLGGMVAEGVTEEVTAGVDPRSVPHESQAKICA